MFITNCSISVAAEPALAMGRYSSTPADPQILMLHSATTKTTACRWYSTSTAKRIHVKPRRRGRAHIAVDLSGSRRASEGRAKFLSEPTKVCSLESKVLNLPVCILKTARSSAPGCPIEESHASREFSNRKTARFEVIPCHTFSGTATALKCFGPRNLAEVCQRHRLPLLTFSSDLVFGGERSDPYPTANEASGI
jgi:hypothetical protein